MRVLLFLLVLFTINYTFADPCSDLLSVGSLSKIIDQAINKHRSEEFNAENASRIIKLLGETQTVYKFGVDIEKYPILLASKNGILVLLNENYLAPQEPIISVEKSLNISAYEYLYPTKTYEYRDPVTTFAYVHPTRNTILRGEIAQVVKDAQTMEQTFKRFMTEYTLKNNLSFDELNKLPIRFTGFDRTKKEPIKNHAWIELSISMIKLQPNSDGSVKQAYVDSNEYEKFVTELLKIL